MNEALRFASSPEIEMGALAVRDDSNLDSFFSCVRDCRGPKNRCPRPHRFHKGPAIYHWLLLPD